MSKIINKLLLARDKFVPEMHSRQPGFTYSACGLFPKNKERIRKFKETGYSSYIYQNKLDKVCFQHDIAYGDLKVYPEKQWLIKYYVIKQLTLLKIIQNMLDINMDLL